MSRLRLRWLLGMTALLVCLGVGWMLSIDSRNLQRRDINRDINEVVEPEGNKEISFKKPIPYTEARPVFEAFEQRPPAESTWTDWVEQHDNAIHQRIQSGDIDSIVHFWFYGTS